MGRTYIENNRTDKHTNVASSKYDSQELLEKEAIACTHH